VELVSVVTTALVMTPNWVRDWASAVAGLRVNASMEAAIAALTNVIRVMSKLQNRLCCIAEIVTFSARNVASFA
jgi:hypothetical protein